jgi:hypothetical protein
MGETPPGRGATGDTGTTGSPPAGARRAVSRRALLGGVGTGALAGALLAGRPGPADAYAAADPGANELEFIGRLLQEGGQFTGFGYLTALRGVPAAWLFEDGAPPSEQAARLTVHVLATLTSIARVNGVFVVRAAGVLRIYLRDAPGADFADPSSFAEGTLVVEDEAEFQNTLTVTDPDRGIASVVAGLTRRHVATFLMGGQPCRIGHLRLRSRLTAAGQGVRTDPDLPAAAFDLGGHVTAAGG